MNAVFFIILLDTFVYIMYKFAEKFSSILFKKRLEAAKDCSKEHRRRHVPQLKHVFVECIHYFSRAVNKSATIIM